jgi:hypothetical protein
MKNLYHIDTSGYLQPATFKTTAGQALNTSMSLDFVATDAGHGLRLEPHIFQTAVQQVMPSTPVSSKEFMLKHLFTYNGIDKRTKQIAETLVYEFDETTLNPVYYPQNFFNLIQPPITLEDGGLVVGIDHNLGLMVLKYLTAEANVVDAYSIRYNAPLLNMGQPYPNINKDCVYLDGWYTSYSAAVRTYRTNAHPYNKGQIVSNYIREYNWMGIYPLGAFIVYENNIYENIVPYTYDPAVHLTFVAPNDTTNTHWAYVAPYVKFYIVNADIAFNTGAPEPWNEPKLDPSITFEQWYMWLRTLEHEYDASTATHVKEGRYVQTQHLVTIELCYNINEEVKRICDACKDSPYRFSEVEQWVKLEHKKRAAIVNFLQCNFKEAQRIIESTRDCGCRKKLKPNCGCK